MNTTTNTATELAIEVAGQHTPAGALHMLTLPAAELAAELSKLTGGTVELSPEMERIVRALLVGCVLRG